MTLSSKFLSGAPLGFRIPRWEDNILSLMQWPLHHHSPQPPSWTSEEFREVPQWEKPNPQFNSPLLQSPLKVKVKGRNISYPTTNGIFAGLMFLLGAHDSFQFSSVQSLSRVWLFVTPWTAACQASLSITNSWSLLRLMSIESMMPSNQFILCHPLILLPSIFPSIGVFSNESVLLIGWPKYWNFSFNISSSI